MVNEIYLIGGDWNMNGWIDFPYNYWEWKIIPTDFHSIIFQRGRSTTNQLVMMILTVFGVETINHRIF